MRTGCRRSHRRARKGRSPPGTGKRHRRPADGVARSMLLYWHHFSRGASASSRDRRRFDRRAPPAPVARQAASADWVREMHTSLIPLRGARVNASTFTCRVIAAPVRHLLRYLRSIGALRGPKHGGANEFAFEVLFATGSRRGRNRHHAKAAGQGDPSSASATRLHNGDPRNKVIKEVAGASRELAGHEALRHRERIEQVTVAGKEDVRQSGLV